MYDQTFYKQVQISRSDMRPHIKWAVSLVILHMVTSIFLWALCGYIWANILTFSPRGEFSEELDLKLLVSKCLWHQNPLSQQYLQFKPQGWLTGTSWYNCTGAAAATVAANWGVSTWGFKLDKRPYWWWLEHFPIVCFNYLCYRVCFMPASTPNKQSKHNTGYCKSTNFGVLLYLANLANCVFSLIFVAANIYVERTLHRRAAERRQI